MGALFFCLWKPASTSGSDTSPIARLAESLQRHKTVTGQQRHVIQIRTYRWYPSSSFTSSQKGEAEVHGQTRSNKPKTMFILRNSVEFAQVLIDDPQQQSQSQKQEEQSPGEDNLVHGRSTVMTATSSSWETLLARSLSLPAPHNPQSAQNAEFSGWAAKPPSMHVEGFAVVVGDFVVRAGNIVHRGGQNAGFSGKILVEVEYLPATTLPSHALMEEFLRDILPYSDLIVCQPAQIQAAFDAASLPAPGSMKENEDAAAENGGAVVEWNERHKTAVIVGFLRSQGLL